MDVKKKLLEMLIEAWRNDPRTGSFSEYLAEYLISNGVTVKEWISVDDRMPENDDIVAVIVSGKVGNITLVKAFELATFSLDEGRFLEMWPEWENAKVTHWMPLQDPPKGE